MGESPNKLTQDSSLVREIYATTLKEIDSGFPGRLPHVDTVIKKSHIDENKQLAHKNARLFLWNTHSYAALMTDFSYLHSAQVHKGRKRHSSQNPYTHHLFEAGANFTQHTSFPHHPDDIALFAKALIGINRHDNSEEQLDDYLQAHPSNSPASKSSLRKEFLLQQHDAYNTLISVAKEKLNLSSQTVQYLKEFEIDNLIVEDKLSRGRRRANSSIDPYSDYTEKSLAGRTQIAGYQSNVIHELLSEIDKCYESGQNGDTIFPHGGWLLKNKSDELSELEKELLLEVSEEFHPGKIIQQNDTFVYQPGGLRKKRLALEELYKKSLTQLVSEQESIQATKQLADLRKRFIDQEKRYTDVLTDHVKIISPHSRADTIQWNAYIANMTLRSARSAATHAKRAQQVSPWLVETTKQAALNLAEKTLLHAQMQMDNEIVYERFSLSTAHDILEKTRAFQEYEASFKFTSPKETLSLPPELQPYDQFTSWLVAIAKGDQEAIQAFKESKEIQFRQMAIASALCYRLLNNHSNDPSQLEYAPGKPQL